MVLTKAMQVRVARGFYYIEGRLMTAEDLKWMEQADVEGYLDAARSQIQPYDSSNAGNDINAEVYDQTEPPAAGQTYDENQTGDQVEYAATAPVRKRLRIRRTPLIAAGVLAGVAGVWAITAAIVSSGHTSAKSGSSLATDAASVSNDSNQQGQQGTQGASQALAESVTSPAVTTPAPVTPLTKPSPVAKPTTTINAPSTQTSANTTPVTDPGITQTSTIPDTHLDPPDCSIVPKDASCPIVPPKTEVDCTVPANAEDTACLPSDKQ